MFSDFNLYMALITFNIAPRENTSGSTLHIDEIHSLVQYSMSRLCLIHPNGVEVSCLQAAYIHVNIHTCMHHDYIDLSTGVKESQNAVYTSFSKLINK